jgi:hypothetical protein
MIRVRGVSLGFVVAAALAASTGCNLLKPLAMMAPPPTERVPAEFDKLDGSKAIVLVWAEPDVLFDYPNVRLELGAYVADYLRTHVKDVQFLAARQVEDYVERQASMTQDPVAIGRHFHVDKVIHITLIEFSMRDREMAHFYRGRVRASVAVYDLKDKSGTPQRYALTDASVTYPENQPMGMDSSAAQVVRQKTYETFADTVGRKFYAYDREK